jgi:hypothetical protein
VQDRYDILVTPVSCGCGSLFTVHRWPRFALLEMPTQERPLAFLGHRVGDRQPYLMADRVAAGACRSKYARACVVCD